VVLGTVVRETISVVQEVRKLGWTVTLIGTTPAYSPEIIEIGGAASEGLYASSPFTLPFAVRKDPSPQLEQWIESYRKRFGEAPKLGTVMGYTAMNLFVEAAKRAGPNLTTAAMTQAIEGLSLPPDFLGNVAFQFSPTNHVGGRAVRVNKVENGKWTAASDFLEK
jgi:branched-chain amino acid transport system substrate-binding protein